MSEVKSLLCFLYEMLRLKIFWINLVSVKFGLSNIYGFQIKVENNQIAGIKLIWVLRLPAKVFYVFYL